MKTKPNLIFMDCETTGLDAHEDQILSITMSSVDAVSGDVTETKRVRIAYRGDTPINPDAVATHRINPLTHRGLREKDAAREINDFFSRHGGESTPIAGYNVGFDAKFVRSLLARSGYDGKQVSLEKMDLLEQSKKMIYRQQFPVQSLETKRYTDRATGAIKERVSLKQQSVARALKIDVDPAKLHDDQYDVETSIEVWRRLGRPRAPRKYDNSPYGLQDTCAGSIIEVKEWDNTRAQVQTRRYYVTGEGAGESDQTFSDKIFHKTIVIPVDTESFSDAGERMKREIEAAKEGKKLKKGGLGVTAIDKISSEWGFDRQVFSVKKIDASDEELQLARDLHNVVCNRVRENREKANLETFNTKLRAVEKNFKLTNPMDKRTVLDSGAESMIPVLAKKMRGMSDAERVNYVSELANKGNHGTVWAYTMLRLTERYGYRNGMEGFENERKTALAEIMPERGRLVEMEKGRADLSEKSWDALKAAGYRKIKFVSDGTGVQVIFFPLEQANKNVSTISFNNVVDGSGAVISPKAKLVADGIQLKLSCTAAEATDIRRGFTGYVDRTSYEAVTAEFKRKIKSLEAAGDMEGAAVLKDTLKSMGPDYKSFLATARSPSRFTDLDSVEEDGRSSNPQGSLSPDDRGALEAYMTNAERVKAEIVAGYAAVPGHDMDALAGADLRQILEANLDNPATEELKRLDELARDHNINLADGVIDSSPASNAEPAADPLRDAETGDLGQRLNITMSGPELTHSHAHGQGEVRCKVCGRSVRDKNAVAGMGPKCAKRLLTFIAENSSEDQFRRLSFQKVSSLEDGDGRLPIMVVRDKRSGHHFAADLVRKESDGRFLVVDLSEIAKRTRSGGFSPVKDAARVYLDEESYEVAQVLPAHTSSKKVG